MKLNCKKKLKREKSANYSGELLNLGKITILKEANYCIEPVDLDGDAPKRFIRAYFYESGGAVYKSRIKTWKAYIAKSANKWYPHESVTEFLINKIGETIGLNVNKIMYNK